MATFPSLSEVSHLKTKKSYKKEDHTHHYVCPQPQPHPQGPQERTPFVWAGVVGGEKINLSEKQKVEQEKKKMEQEKQLAEKEKRLAEEKDRLLRAELSAQNQLAKYEEEKKKRLEEQQEIDKKLKEKYSPQNGYMDAFLQQFPEEGNVWRDVPVKVNEKAVNFVQLWLSNWKDHMKAKTVGEIVNFFYAAFVPWALQKYDRHTYDFEDWESTTYPSQAAANQEMRYSRMRIWAQYAETTYNSKTPWERDHWCISPPWKNPFWLEVTHTTWENCLKAMNSPSATFEGGLFTISGYYAQSSSTLTWNRDHMTTEGAYISTRFQRKAMTPAQQKREQKREQERLEKQKENGYDEDWW